MNRGYYSITLWQEVENCMHLRLGHTAELMKTIDNGRDEGPSLL